MLKSDNFQRTQLDNKPRGPGIGCLLEIPARIGTRGTLAHCTSAWRSTNGRTHSRLEYECCDPSKYMRCAPLPCKQGLLNAVKWLSDSGRGRVPNFSVQPSRPLPSCENSQTLRCNSNEFPLLSAQPCSLLLLAC